MSYIDVLGILPEDTKEALDILNNAYQHLCDEEKEAKDSLVTTSREIYKCADTDIIRRSEYLLKRKDSETNKKFNLINKKKYKILKIIENIKNKISNASEEEFNKMLEYARSVKTEDVLDIITTKKNTKWVCPVHTEKTPSLSVKDKMWKCFGCGVSGRDAISLVMKTQQLNFRESVKWINERV